VTRIIAGTAGGRRIKAPAGASTRPTSDRVREALFSAIDSELGSVAGLAFLDLYAGSGAVALEARSRGAGVVTLVEHDRGAAALIRDNIRTLGFEGVDVVVQPVSRALARPPRTPYDIAFLDPPYIVPVGQVEAALRDLREHRWLVPGALVIVERSVRDHSLTWPVGLEAERTKRYGETLLWYGHAANP